MQGCTQGKLSDGSCCGINMARVDVVIFKINLNFQQVVEKNSESVQICVFSSVDWKRTDSILYQGRGKTR